MCVQCVCVEIDGFDGECGKCEASKAPQHLGVDLFDLQTAEG